MVPSGIFVPAGHGAMTPRERGVLSPPRQARRGEFLWLCGLVLSFAYELPIWYATSMDRVNPRLFDVMVCLGLFLVLPGLRRGPRVPRLFRIWAAIVAVFCFCALVWTTGFLPWEYGQFSLFFAAKYVEGLIAIYIAIRIPLDERQKRILHYVAVGGGIFVALYSIWQYGSGTTEWKISGGKTVGAPEGAIFGPLSRSYFHVGMFSTLSFAMALALVPTARTVGRSWLLIGLAFFVAWPALACGSRAAIAGVAIVLVVSVFLRPILLRKSLAIVALAACFIFVANMDVHAFNLEEASIGFQRFETYEDSENSIWNRIFREYSFNQYMWDGLPVPFIGAGFYVAPVDAGLGSLHYRVGYGIHNAYLFPIEQGGIIAFMLFVWFLLACLRRLNAMRKERRMPDKVFALGMLTFFIALLLPFMLSGLFWINVGTAHFCIYTVLLIFIACKPSTVEICGNSRPERGQVCSALSRSRPVALKE